MPKIPAPASPQETARVRAHFGESARLDSNRATIDRYGHVKFDLSPTLGELADRASLMGLVLCTCTGVDGEDGKRHLIHDPACQVHR